MNKDIEKMETFELSRWYALMEAVDIIASECKDRDIDFDSLKMSPLGIEKYIESTCDKYAQKIEKEKAAKNASVLEIQKYLIKKVTEEVPV